MAMTEDELKAIVVAEMASAVGSQDTEMSGDRIDGWDAYLKQPYGNEIDGRSQVVSSDVQDTVEWIMPSLMRIFTAGDTAVEFNPTGQEDEQSAKQATDYANYVWDRDNPGFLNFHTWFKEALIAKVGTVKVYWEVKDKWKRERYEGLDEASLGLALEDGETEITEMTERQVQMPPSLDQMPEPGAPPPMPTMATVYDVVLRKKQSAGKICVDPVPGDEILFSRDAKNPQTCRFFAHKTKKTISDLIEQYPDKRKTIENLSTDGPSTIGSSEAISRSTVNEESNSPYTSAINEAMRELWVTEAYVRVDYDDDGIAEMRKVTIAGQTEVLDNEEWEGPRPFACISPILMPHRLVGLSIPDLIKDIQLIKTAILRQFLDALYVANNPRMEVVEDLIVDPAEVLTSKPNGIVRVKGNGSVPAMRPIATTPVADQALLGLNYVDQLRENRTGVSPRTQGLGSETLHDTKGGQELLFDAAKMRVEMIARIFAETGVKDAFKLILWLASQYQDKPRTIRLRNQWIPMDPREWSDEYDMTANVGLGHNDQTQKMMGVQMIAAAQAQIVALQGGAQGPLVTEENIFNTSEKLVEAAGFRTPELFFSNPKTTPAPPPKPNPEMMKVQGEMALRTQEAQMKAQLDQQQAQQQAALQETQLNRQAQIEAAQAQADMAVEQQKAQLQMQLAQQKAALEMALAKSKHQIDVRGKVLDMRMKARQARQNPQAQK
jgi:hypothetical protein